MVTRLYLHNTANGTTGLPTTKQSTQSSAAGSAQAVTVNKNMSTTIGTSQQSIAITTGGSSGYIYWGRWVSDVISQTSIAANTWTFSFGYDSFWGSSDVGVVANIFVWRPTTTTKIGTISDTSTSQSFSTTETGYKLTLTGSAVSSITSGTDVLCVEFLGNTSLGGGSAHFYYDGTTVVTTNNTSASSVASYIETPEDVTIGPILSIPATSTGKVIASKIITKA